MASAWRDDVVVHVVPVDKKEDMKGEGVNAWQSEPPEANRVRALQATIEAGVFMVGRDGRSYSSFAFVRK